MPVPPFTRHQLRRTACVTLFAWVFALMSGLANACLLQANGSGESHLGHTLGERISRDAAGATSTDRQVGYARPHGDGENNDPGEDGGKDGCLKFCADGSSALTKSKASQTDLPGPILVASVHGPFATPVATDANWPLIERPASVGLPPFLRLLRLTL